MASPPIAEQLAKKQKEISVSEFFERNKHILGFDSSIRALITSVKEAVDNALDACEEASILPDIRVDIGKVDDDEYQLVVEDNGPGIVKRQMANIFGKLLYGSRFHAIRQSRGQQGIGISAAVMYGQLTTGKAAVVESKIGEGKPVVRVHLKLDTRNNKPDIVKEEIDHWEKPHGTRIAIHMPARYQRGQQSVFEYLRSTAIVNPHARITFKEPDGTVTIFERATEQLPEPTKEIKPHPTGIEMGTLLKMAKHTDAKWVSSFLTSEFSRVTSAKAKEICDRAAKLLPVDHKLHGDADKLSRLKPNKMDVSEARAILKAVRNVKLMAPPTDCLSPIGEVLVKKGLKKELPDTEFVSTVTRPAGVYQGRPFQVEVGIAYGGDLPKDQQVRIIRFANRVPLLYQKGACVSTQAVEGVDWRRYGLEQRGGRGVPIGPAVILVHVASVNVPFTSEAKEAIADIEEIRKEVTLALQECGRKLGSHLRKKAKVQRMREKETVIRRLIPKLAEKAAVILEKPVPDYEPVIARIMDNVMITDDISHDGAKKRVTVDLTISNYTTKSKNFTLYSVIPHGVKVADVKPKPYVKEDGLIAWKVTRLASVKKEALTFSLEGLDEGDFDETELYVHGIDAERVLGAEQWKGKLDEEPTERITTITADGETIDGLREVDDEESDVEDEDLGDDLDAVEEDMGDLMKVDARETTSGNGRKGRKTRKGK